MASILQSGKRRRGARGICASIALAARKKPLLRDEHDHAADWLHCSVCKNKCMLLCMLVSFNECVSASTRRETSHIDSPLRLAARGSRTPMPCSAASASSAVRILSSGAKRSRCARPGGRGGRPSPEMERYDTTNSYKKGSGSRTVPPSPRAKVRFLRSRGGTGSSYRHNHVLRV